MKKSVLPFVLPFEDTIKNHNLDLKRREIKTLQVNMGKLCNQACHHCHVEAGPKRTEIMDRSTIDRILQLLKLNQTIETVDITGGAPELNPNFKYFVSKIHKLEKKTPQTIIDRCNLTILFEKGQEETAKFLREYRVNIVASLPCYSKENVDSQRGNGVFDKSIKALQLLNTLGYGKTDSGLKLDLVYNPIGAFLPPSQETLEKDYKKELKELFGIEFNCLFTFTNMPIQRFLKQLEREARLQEYMDVLVQNFNPKAAENIMCRDLVSISWDGQIYDCDFNQMLEIQIYSKEKTLWTIESIEELARQNIVFAEHCYGCTAGNGSSCSGSIIEDNGG
ncbi:arsenosugar biosynthesis radical SAM protein ArsS [Candidatus Nomurabacteria bacterium]|nr:arsenosugar biosynthesis radical SAM protein ArsS [Candidatus Nomurabacteria bacterium]